MKEIIDHWKEAIGVVLYFGFLAFFTPKAEAMGWGYQGILFCVLTGALLMFLLYMTVKLIADYIADHRTEISEFKEYMGLGSTQSLNPADLSGDYTETEIDAMLATNPYASTEVVEEKLTHLLASISVGDDQEEEDLDPEKRTAILGENPRRRLLMAENFQPDANALLRTGVAAFGCPGSGKTTVLVRFLEQYIKRFRSPCVVFDSQGDWKSLIEDDFCPRGILATPENMPRMAAVVKFGLQVIVDLSEWHEENQAEMSFELAARLMARTIRELMAAQKAIDASKRIPCLVAIDETHLWVPQTPPSYLTQATARSLLDAVIALATTGRKLGVVPFLATQRIARVNKDVIGSVETRLFGKVDLDNDLKRYREYIPESVVSYEQIRAFRAGEMIVTMAGQHVFVQFFDRETQHLSHTPQITQSLDRFAGRLPAEVLEYVTRTADLPRVTAQATAETPACEPPSPVPSSRTSGDLVAVMQQAPAPARIGTPVRRVSLDSNPELKKAYEFYQQGYTSSRKLAVPMGYGSNHMKANDLLKQLRLLGLIP